MRNLKTIAAVVDDSVAAGATTIQGISFRLADPKAVEAQARQLAMTDARTKADALAAAAGVSIKGVATITDSSYTPVPYSAAADKAVAGSVASARSRVVAKAALTSKRTPLRATTTDGPPTSGRQTRPTSAPARPSAGSVVAAVNSTLDIGIPSIYRQVIDGALRRHYLLTCQLEKKAPSAGPGVDKSHGGARQP